MNNQGGPINVALIQSDSRQASLISGLLQSSQDGPFTVSIAETLAAGLQQLATRQIDIVLVDPDLPDSAGLAALTKVQQAPPVHRPMVALIGADDEHSPREVLRKGAYDYLVKGQFDGKMLSHVIHRALTSYETGWRLLPNRGNSRNLVEKSPLGIIVTDLQGTVRFANSAATSMLGRSYEKWIGQPVGFQVPDNGSVEVEIFRRSGERGTGEAVATETTWDNESCRLIMVQNTTQRKQVEEALRESEARFRSLVESANAGLIIGDEDGNIISWNHSAQSIFGYTQEEALGQSITLLMPERYHEAHRRGLEQVRKTSQGNLLGKTVELQALRRNGSEFPVEVSLSTWETGGRRFFGGIIHDITERKQVEAALRESEERFATILDSVHDAIISVDESGLITMFNQGAERIFGYSAPEVLGQPLGMLLPQRFAPVHTQHVLDFLRSPLKSKMMNERGTIYGLRQDGSEFPAEASISKIEVNGERVLTATLRDITDRIQQQLVHEYSTPVLPAREGLLIMPIIGLIDSKRAQQLMEQLLNSIRSNRARVAVMDVTGVPTMDSMVANHVMQTVEAVHLMGARVIVTGLSAEIARTLVTLGIDLSRIDTVGDLQSGIEVADRLLGYRLVTV
jgi:PAS domain S-box-containing protein